MIPKIHNKLFVYETYTFNLTCISRGYLSLMVIDFRKLNQCAKGDLRTHFFIKFKFPIYYLF